jgi:GTP-binding protein
MSQFPNVTFLLSAWQPHQFPPDQGTEIAFAGRSNAGKSSALNAIVGRKAMARVSKTPGRTQLINFFGLDSNRRLADLPGYGYAKVPEEMRRHWRELLTRYVEARQSLAGLVIVMDARRPLTDFDLQMLGWTEANGLATHLLLTKADKLSRSDSALTIRKVRAAVNDGVTVQLFSAVEKTGVDEARRAVLQMMSNPRKTLDEVQGG